MEMANVKIPEKAMEVVKEASNMLAVFDEKFEIANPAEYENTAAIIKKVKAKNSEIDALRKTMTQPLDTAKKAIMDFFRPATTDLATLESRIKAAIIRYQNKLEKERNEKQRELDEQAEKERLRLLEKAKKQEEKGNGDKADDLRQQAETVVAPVVAAPIPKVAGITKTKNWKYRITDAGLIPREYLIPNETMIGQVVRSTKGAIQIPGIDIYSEDGISAGRK